MTKMDALRKEISEIPMWNGGVTLMNRGSYLMSQIEAAQVMDERMNLGVEALSNSFLSTPNSRMSHPRLSAQEEKELAQYGADYYGNERWHYHEVRTIKNGVSSYLRPLSPLEVVYNDADSCSDIYVKAARRFSLQAPPSEQVIRDRHYLAEEERLVAQSHIDSGAAELVRSRAVAKKRIPLTYGYSKLSFFGYAPNQRDIKKSLIRSREIIIPIKAKTPLFLTAVDTQGTFWGNSEKSRWDDGEYVEGLVRVYINHSGVAVILSEIDSLSCPCDTYAERRRCLHVVIMNNYMPRIIQLLLPGSNRRLK